jgi:hypothetical protein
MFAFNFFRAGKPNLFIERAFPRALPFFSGQAEFQPCEPNFYRASRPFFPIKKAKPP